MNPDAAATTKCIQRCSRLSRQTASAATCSTKARLTLRLPLKPCKRAAYLETMSIAEISKVGNGGRRELLAALALLEFSSQWAASRATPAKGSTRRRTQETCGNDGSSAWHMEDHPQASRHGIIYNINKGLRSSLAFTSCEASFSLELASWKKTKTNRQTPSSCLTIISYSSEETFRL